MTIESAIQKVQKLLALANEQGGGTDAERDLAMQRAQEIMLKHDLEMSMIEDAMEDKSRAVSDHEFDILEEDWRRYLLDSIARGSFCRTWYYMGSKRTFIVGRPEQVAFVRELYNWLIPQLEAAAVKTAKSYDKRAQYAYLYGLRALTIEVAAGRSDIDIREASQTDISWAGLNRFLDAQYRGEGAEDIANICGIALNYAKEVRPFVKREEIAPGFAQHTGVFMRSFFMSASATVGQRLRETQTRFANEGGENAMALVLNENKAADDYMDAKEDMKKNKSEAKFDREGWGAGARAAADFDLNTNRTVTGTRKELGR
jgi:hypothetical protein